MYEDSQAPLKWLPNSTSCSNQVLRNSTIDGEFNRIQECTRSLIFRVAISKYCLILFNFQRLSASTESNLGSLDTVPAAEIGGPGGSIHPNCSPKEKATTKKCPWSEDQPKRPTNTIDIYICVCVGGCNCVLVSYIIFVWSWAIHSIFVHFSMTNLYKFHQISCGNHCEGLQSPHHCEGLQLPLIWEKKNSQKNVQSSAFSLRNS